MEARPIPESGDRCLHEAMLLALAIRGGIPGAVDERVHLEIESAAKGLTNTSKHVLHTNRGRIKRESWIEHRPDGSARYYPTAPPESDDWPTVTLDDAATPAYDRLIALNERITGVSLSDLDIAYARRFIENTISVTSPDARLPFGIDPFHIELRVKRQELIDRVASLHAQSEPYSTFLSDTSRALHKWLQASREHGQVDGVTAAKTLIALELSEAIGRAAISERAELWVQYLTHGLASVNTGPGPRALLEKAVRAGFASTIDETASALLARGDEARERALDAPTQRKFAKLLYNGYPLLYAALLLFGHLAELLPAHPSVEQWRRQRAVSEERSIRFSDGMIESWRDIGKGRQWAEREMIAAAWARHDRREIRRIIVDGEQALLRPRSARAFLLADLPEGTGP